MKAQIVGFAFFFFLLMLGKLTSLNRINAFINANNYFIPH